MAAPAVLDIDPHVSPRAVGPPKSKTQPSPPGKGRSASRRNAEAAGDIITGTKSQVAIRVRFVSYAVTPEGRLNVMTPSITVDLANTFRGPLLVPHDDGYDLSRRVWNGNIDRNPYLIARCTTPGGPGTSRTNRCLMPVSQSTGFIGTGNRVTTTCSVRALSLIQGSQDLHWAAA